jgi:two-component system, LytTR family, response regulator AlgR
MNSAVSEVTILIVDDEAPARDRLCDLLAECAPALPNRVVGQADNGISAFEMAASTRAKVVLLDIHMPGMSGLQLARHLSRLATPPAIVFITAYDQHAVEAFEIGAMDYLLKPVRHERLLTALQRASPLKPEQEALLAQRGGGRDRLMLSDRGHVHWLPVSHILFFRAEDKYVIAQTAKEAHLIDDPLVRLEEEFAPRFVRIHRRYLVNRDHVSGFSLCHEQGNHWQAELEGWPEPLPVSRRQAHVIRSFRKNM